MCPSNAESPGILGQSRTTTRILLVDDEATVRDMVVDILSDDDYVVDAAPDGAQALRLLDSHHYDLILSDVRMPELDGPQLVDAIQQRCGAAMPAVVLLTGHARDLRRKALPPGTLVLEKPFSLSALRNVVERSLSADR